MWEFFPPNGREMNRMKSATSVGQGRPLLSGGGGQVPLQLPALMRLFLCLLESEMSPTVFVREWSHEFQHFSLSLPT